MNTVQNNNEELTQAFAAFNTHSQGLHCAYQQLQEKVTVLARALSEARKARIEQHATQQHVTARYAELLEALPAAIIVTDDGGKTVDANVHAIDLLGDQLLGSVWRECEAANFLTCAMDGADMNTKDGRIFNAVRSPLADGGELIVLSDVTQARAASDAAHRHQRLAMLGEMAARMAHQIRTPLSAAMLYAAEASVDNGAREKLLSRLTSLASLVDDMLRFAGGTPHQQATLNSGLLLCKVADEARDILPDGVTLRVLGNGQSVELSANQDAIVAALHNLISNAAQHIEGSGRITLSDHCDSAGNVLLCVEDTGVGIAENLREQIFEPFFTTRSAGTGLGLAIVRSIARAHDGDVDCHAGATGSVFRLRLPYTKVLSDSVQPADDVPQFAISASASSAFSALRGVAHA